MSDPLHLAEGAWHSYLDKWLAAQPGQRVALAFVPPDRYPGHVALAALEHEWLAATQGIREPEVATAKLDWWAQELDAALNGGAGRHPLSQVLFADPRGRAIDRATWLAPLHAALAQLDAGTAADFPAQLAAASGLHGALARLETAWWFGPQADAVRAQWLASWTALVDALRALEADAERSRLPLPMARLARHGLSRAQLRASTPAREDAVRGQLDDLLAAWDEAAASRGPVGVFRAIAAQRARRAVQRARRAATPLTALHEAHQATRPADAWAAWRAARAWRRTVL